MDAKRLVSFLRDHHQLMGVLIGAAIVLASMGTYTNWDAQTEFEAATSVVTRGFPYVGSGFMIDQPPFAFYMTAPVLQAFGVTYANGVGFVTFLGLGCVVLVYILGTVLYGKNTGLAAAALFGLVPWQVFMARIYLIDVQYLFLGLLFLLLGVLAVKKNSPKLLAASGVLFALAFLTKLFTIFLFVPFLLFVLLKQKESGFKITAKNILIFLLPSLIFQALWYGGFANQHFFGVYMHSDFALPDLIANPSVAFLPRLFLESTGWFLLAAAIFSLSLAFSLRRLFSRTLWADIVCFVTVLVVAAVDLGLVFGEHLLVPYISAFKYNYAALPFLCLLAASLIDKGAVLAHSVGRRAVKLAIAGLGIALLLASLVESALFLNHSEPYPLVDFKVDFVGHYFPFFVSSPVNGSFQTWHYMALALMLASLCLPYVHAVIGRRIIR